MTKNIYGLIFCLLVLSAISLLEPQTISCQTEKLDIVTYAPPSGWIKTPKGDAVLFVDSNKTTNTFCVLTVHSSTASHGSPKADFEAEWKAFAADPHGAEANPKTETQTADGWTIVTANAPIEIEGVKSLVFLIVYSGFGKTTSILALLNSDTYIKPLGTFLESVKLDKTPAVSQQAARSNQPAANSYDPAALVGKWGNGTAGNTVSGSYITYGSNASQKYYQFNSDGTYAFVYSGYSGIVGTAGAFHITTTESGVYTLNGDSMTITPKKSQTNSNSGGLKNNPLEIVTYRWTIHYFEGIQEYALIMHPDHQTKRDGGFDYVLAFPDSYSYSKAK